MYANILCPTYSQIQCIPGRYPLKMGLYLFFKVMTKFMMWITRIIPSIWPSFVLLYNILKYLILFLAKSQPLHNNKTTNVSATYFVLYPQFTWSYPFFLHLEGKDHITSLDIYKICNFLVQWTIFGNAFSPFFWEQMHIT